MGTIELHNGDAALVLRANLKGELHYQEQEDGDDLFGSTMTASLLLICMQTPSIMKEAKRIFDEIS